MAVRKSGSTSTRGILQAGAGLDKFALSRFEPGPQLKPFVEHYWVVRYNLPPGTTHTQRVLTYPNIHMAFEHDDAGCRALVYGVVRRPFVRELRGSGRVLGIKFRAGCFYPFWQKDVALLTGRTVPATELFGAAAGRWVHEVLDAGEDEAMAQQADAALATCLPERDDRAELAARIVDAAMNDRSFIRVEQLSRWAGLSVRQLQRLFHRYVGVTPKWVIKRFRLQEAAERIEADPSTPWPDLAAQLGYFDQAHFIKDFKSVLGQTPAEYSRQAARAPGSPGSLLSRRE